MIDSIAILAAANLALVPDVIKNAMPNPMSWSYDFRQEKKVACFVNRLGLGVCQYDFDWNSAYKSRIFAINDSVKGVSYRVIGDSLYAIPFFVAYDKFGLASRAYSTQKCFDNNGIMFLCGAPASNKAKIEYEFYDFLPGGRIVCRANRDTIADALPINDSLFSAKKLLCLCNDGGLKALTRRAGSIVDGKVMTIPDWGAVLAEDIYKSVPREHDVIGVYRDSLLSQSTLDTYLLQHLYSKGSRKFKLPIRGKYDHCSVTRSEMQGDSVRVYYIPQGTGEYTPFVFSVSDGVTIQSRVKGVLPKVINKLNRQLK